MFIAECDFDCYLYVCFNAFFLFEETSKIAYCLLFSSFSSMSFQRDDGFLTRTSELLCKCFGFVITSIGK